MTKIEVRRYADETREDCERRIVDHFYTLNGICCAGCDWWRMGNVLVGECIKSAPVSAADKWSMIGIYSSTYPASAGHVMTLREHVCGDFKDDFDWSILPSIYLKRIGRNAKGEKA